MYYNDNQKVKKEGDDFLWDDVRKARMSQKSYQRDDYSDIRKRPYDDVLSEPIDSKKQNDDRP